MSATPSDFEVLKRAFGVEEDRPPRPADWCKCGHAHGWHDNGARCNFGGCECRAWEPRTPVVAAPDDEVTERIEAPQRPAPLTLRDRVDLANRVDLLNALAACAAPLARAAEFFAGLDDDGEDFAQRLRESFMTVAHANEALAEGIDATYPGCTEDVGGGR